MFLSSFFRFAVRASLQRDDVFIMLQEPWNKEKFEADGQREKGLSICLQCANALVLYHEFSGMGIEIKEPFVGNDLRAVIFPNPDDYQLAFERPTDVPEETKYLFL